MAHLPGTLHIACGQCGDTIALLVQPTTVHPTGYTNPTTVLSVDTRLLDAHNTSHHPTKEA
ncbi:hypothetical protein ACK8HH_17170 [Gordonia sp. LUNF6]|uniref:hypothetical protein n=1 Tax=unclassified Gordonia (in: high G+C Gram-positive bacteria) TaxID=2657482 RepID=UPI00398AEB9E